VLYALATIRTVPVLEPREAAATLSGARPLPVDPTSCFVHCDDLQHAIELVEQGRGQQWSLTSRLRTPLEDMKLTSPELAHRLSEINKCMSDAQSSAGSPD
jgi:hypothetical protein